MIRKSDPMVFHAPVARSAPSPTGLGPDQAGGAAGSVYFGFRNIFSGDLLREKIIAAGPAAFVRYLAYPTEELARAAQAERRWQDHCNVGPLSPKELRCHMAMEAAIYAHGVVMSGSHSEIEGAMTIAEAAEPETVRPLAGEAPTIEQALGEERLAEQAALDAARILRVDTGLLGMACFGFGAAVWFVGALSSVGAGALAGASSASSLIAVTFGAVVAALGVVAWDKGVRRDCDDMVPDETPTEDGFGFDGVNFAGKCD